VAQDGDWAQWRGTRRNAVAADVRLPRDWLAAELKVRWRVPVGEGYATPLLAGDRVYTFGREGTSEVVQAHERATGKVRWRVAYPAKYEVREIAGVHGAGPRATPVVHAGRIFTFGINEVLHAIDLDSGRILWRIDFPRRFGTDPPGYGASSSPIVVGRLLLVAAADRVIAVDWRGGSIVWRALDDSFYSSLMTARFADRDQIVGFARYRLVGLKPRDGRLLWTLPYPSLWGSNIVTPIVWRDRVIVSSPAQGTRAVRVRVRGDRWVAEPVWQTRSLQAYLTSPVVRDDHMYALDESGRLHCIDLRDGRTAWRSGDFSDFGTLVLAGDQLLILTGYGELAAVEATPVAYRELGRREVASSPTWAHLVITRDAILVRDRTQLTCFELPTQPRE
jgi:outer membrane protein assembly factor BamB